MPADHAFEPAPVNVRTKIAAAWTAVLFVFAYVDLFSLYRPDIRSELARGELAGFPIGEPFLLAVTAYVAVPSLMVVGSLVLPARASRIANLVLPVGYAVTIVGAAIGEMGYYLLGSGIEVVLLAAIARLAWTWPRRVPAAASVEAAAAVRVEATVAPTS